MSDMGHAGRSADASAFLELGISGERAAALAAVGITAPTGVQRRVIPEILSGASLLFESETGTGKTLAYLLPLVQRISATEDAGRGARLVVVAPTVELASQIKAQAGLVTAEKVALLVGGAPLKRQAELLREKPPIVVGGPARLLELLHLGKLRPGGVEAVVLDEVDRLASPELRDCTAGLLAALGSGVQLVGASATVTEAAERIVSAAHFSARARTVRLLPEDVLRKRITHLAIFSEERDKTETLRKLLAAEGGGTFLVFTSRADRVQGVVSALSRRRVRCAGVHAKADKVTRKRAVDAFRRGAVDVLVTSDLSSRGLDFPRVTHVVQMDLPGTDDFFVHRAGRTARAGRSGLNIVIGDEREMRRYAALEKRLGIVVRPRVLRGGALVPPDALFRDEIEANGER